MPGPSRRVEQVAEAIASDARALAAALQPGDDPKWLPTWDELARRHHASKSTVREALALLAEREVIELVPRTGARVLPPLRVVRDTGHQEEIRGQWRGHHLAAADAGLKPWEDPTVIRTVPAGRDVAHFLGVPVGTLLVQRSRRHGVIQPGQGRVPTMLSWTWLAPDVAAVLPVARAADTGRGGITSRFIDAGLLTPPPQWDNSTGARAADIPTAVALGVKPGDPLVEVWRTCSDGPTGRVLEVTLMVANPARYRFVYP